MVVCNNYLSYLTVISLPIQLENICPEWEKYLYIDSFDILLPSILFHKIWQVSLPMLFIWITKMLILFSLSILGWYCL